MPNNIYHKRNANSGVVPTAAQLTVGEIALNTADGKAYTRTTAGTVVELTEASVADGGEQFTPLNVANLAMWLDASDTSTLFQTEAANFSAINNPLELGNCILWLDGADTATMFDATSGGNQVSSGGAVARWQDKSGGNRHVVQTNSALRPTMLTNSLNGRAVIRFDGVDDRLNYGSSASNFVRPVTLFVVARKNNTQSDGGLFSLEKAGQNAYDNDSLFCLTTNSNGAAIRALGGVAASMYPGVGNPADTLGTFITSLVISPSTSTTAELRNVAAEQLSSDTSFTFASNPTNNGFVVGSISTSDGGSGNTYPHALNGDIAEIIAYSAALTPAQRVGVEKYLATKWGVANVHSVVAATATNDPVGAWRDKSGNNRHATQSQAANRPLRGTINGRAAIAFTGANSHALTTTLASAFGDSIGPYTIFGVANNTLGANDRALIGAITTGNFDIALYYNSLNTNTPVVNLYTTAGSRFHTSPVVATNPTVFSFAIQRTSSTAANTTISLWQNGVRLHTLSSLGTYSLGSLRKFLETIGATRTSAGAVSNAMTGNFCELVVYPQALTEAQIIALSQYANTKWGATFATFPRVSNAEAQDWINRVYTNNGTVSVSTANAVNTFCNAIDAAGIRDRFYRLNLFCGNNLNACLTPLYRGQSLGGTQFGNATDTNNNFAASDYNERGTTGGLLGDGSSKYLNTGVITDLFASATDGHLSYYAPQWTPTTTLNPGHTALGAQASGGAAIIYGRGNSGSCGAATAAHVGVIGTTGGTLCGEVGNDIGGGHTIVSRTGSAAFGAGLYRNGTLAVSGNPNTYTPSNLPAYVFAFSFSLSGAVSVGGWSPIRMRGYSFGLGMTNSQISALYNATQAFQTTLARNV